MKTLFFLFTIVASLSLNAQITKNNWLVGGELNFIQSNIKSTSSQGTNRFEGFSIRLNANVGYFPLNKFAIGLSSRFNYNMPKGRNNSIGGAVGPFARYYFLKPDNLINLFSQVEYLYGTGYSEGVRSSHSNDFNIKAGPSIFFNSSVALEVTLGYQYTETTFLNSGSSSSQIENNNLILGVGLQIHLEK